MSDSELAAPLCYAEVYVHRHFATHQPIDIDVFRWSGDRYMLGVLEETEIGDLEDCLLGLPTEQAISVKITFAREDESLDGPPVWAYYVESITQSEKS